MLCRYFCGPYARKTAGQAKQHKKKGGSTKESRGKSAGGEDSDDESDGSAVASSDLSAG
jgi:hypothetical protein